MRRLVAPGAAVAVIAAATVLGACSGPPAPPAAPRAVASRSASASGAGRVAGSVAWLRAENARPGTTAWVPHGTRIHVPGLDAFADRVSVLPGQSVGLAISGSGPVSVRAFRMGWYGGALGRLVWSGSVVAHPQPKPVTLNAPIADAGGVRNTRTIVAPWRTSLLVATTGWPEGEYLFRLDAGAATRYVPLTLRSADAAGRELIVAGTMTWQAYNLWGGRSLYGDDTKNLAQRSYAVSYDRPYLDHGGMGRWPEFDAGVVQQAERSGVPLAYTTDYDLAVNASILAGAAAIVIGGHAEYWTGPMRDAVVAAVGTGTNLAILGANTAYWRVRLAGRTGTVGDNRPAGRRDGNPRLIVGAKDAGLDPLAARDPGGATTKFRSPPGARREDALTGMQYDCHPAEAPLTISDPGWWGYAGTGLRAGQQLAHVVGPESDRVYPVPGRPTPEDVVAYTRFSCAGHPTAQTSVYWVAHSGAGVFTAGTMRWACATDGGCSEISDPREQAIMARITDNILTAFATARAGGRHPATDTVSRYWLPAGNTTGAA